jgi:curved DNA-binding protein CbpA
MTIQESFRILKIEETFDPKVIKKAYRKQVLALHPDKNKKNTSQDFIQLKKAYHHLLASIVHDFSDEYDLKNRYSRIYEADKIYKEKIKKHRNLSTTHKKSKTVNNSKKKEFSLILLLILLILFLIFLKNVC